MEAKKTKKKKGVALASDSSFQVCSDIGKLQTRLQFLFTTPVSKTQSVLGLQKNLNSFSQVFCLVAPQLQRVKKLVPVSFRYYAAQKNLKLNYFT